MSLLYDEMRSAYRAQRGVSQGASITLVSRSGGYSAFFDCAAKCSYVLGSRHLEDRGDAKQRLPVYTIPTEELHVSITKLADQFSVALVDLVTDEKGSRFVLVWKIVPSKPQLLAPSADGVGYTPMADVLDEY